MPSLRSQPTDSKLSVALLDLATPNYHHLRQVLILSECLSVSVSSIFFTVNFLVYWLDDGKFDLLAIIVVLI